MSLAKNKAGMIFIFITMLIDILGFGLVIPVMPKLVTQLTGKGISEGSAVYGLLLSSFGLMQFIFSPFLGSLSDRYGRRPVLLLSLAFNTLDYIILATAPSIVWLFVGRILTGITGASFTVASAYIADVSPLEKRAQNFGMIGAAFGIGFIIGPAMGGLLGAHSLRAPFWAAAILSIVNCLYGALVVPESLPLSDRRKITRESLNPIKGLGILTRHSWVAVMAASLILLNLAQQALQSTWVLYTTYRYGWKPIDNGLSLALIGLMSAVVQVGLLRILTPKIGERRSVVIGMVMNVVGFLGIAMATHGWMLYPILIVWSLSGITAPSIQSLLSKQYASNEQGGVQGALTSLQSISGIVGPFLATWVFGHFTAGKSGPHIPGAPFYMGAGLIVIAAIIAVSAMRRHRDSDTTNAVESEGVVA